MKWRFLILAVALLAVVQSSHAGWMRTYEIGEYSIGRSVRQTADGGYIVAGQSGDENQCDLLLIKTDSLGDTLWTRLYGGGGSDVASCIQQTADGKYIVVGHYGGDLWLLKIDARGDTVWTHIYGGSYYSAGNWVEQTWDRGYIVTGSLDLTYLWLFKTDRYGFIEWEKTYEWGDHHETGHCLRITNDGGYVIATNMGLFKTDEPGDSVWLKSWVGLEVQQTSDGGYVLIGNTWAEHGGLHDTELYLMKTDAEGDTLWTRAYGGEEDDGGCSVQQTMEGGYIIVGNTRSFSAGNTDTWLLKTDSLGDTVWTRMLGGERSDKGYSVQQTTDGGYIITGSSNSSSPFTPSDVWLVKTDSLGYVGVEEEPPVQVESNWQVISPIGPHITLRYTDRPQGFAASIFDATGRKVDELHAPLPSGSITWGECYGPGVYFIREESETTSTTRKVILIR